MSSGQSAGRPLLWSLVFGAVLGLGIAAGACSKNYGKYRFVPGSESGAGDAGLQTPVDALSPGQTSAPDAESPDAGVTP